jgi:hypothetical protein
MIIRKEISQEWLQTITVGGQKCLNFERFVFNRVEGVENDVLWEGLGGFGGILLDTPADGIAENAGYEDIAASHDEASPQLIITMRLRIPLLARNRELGF